MYLTLDSWWRLDRKIDIFITLESFYCLSCVYIDQITRNKFNIKSKKWYLIGYEGDEFGCRFWDNEANKIIRSRNISFNKFVLYKDKLSTTIKGNSTPK